MFLSSCVFWPLFFMLELDFHDQKTCLVSRTACGCSPGCFIPSWGPVSLLGPQCCPKYQLPGLGAWQDARLRALVLLSWLDPDLSISTCWFWLGSCFQLQCAACMTSICSTARGCLLLWSAPQNESLRIWVVEGSRTRLPCLSIPCN